MNNIMESGVRPVVSFCIPIYNNAEAAVLVVSNILASDDPRIEVVACDDASTDNVQELLSRIKDPRFRYVRNEKNLGAHKNWCNVLELGQGDWLYLVMGRDKIHAENIGNLITLLERAQSEGALYIKDRGYKSSKLRLYEGIDAMIEFIRYNHPTGSIYNREAFLAIPNRRHYFEISDMYPEVYPARDLLLKGKGAFITSGLYTDETVIELSKIKSRVEYGLDISNVFFAPKRKTKQFYEFIDMIEGDLSGVFSQSELDKYFETRFIFLLRAVSYGWAARDNEFLAHYGYGDHSVSVREMVGNILTAYRDTKTYLRQRGFLTRRKQIKMYAYVAYSVMMFPLMTKIKRLLQGIGVWDLLRKVKMKLFPAKLNL